MPKGVQKKQIIQLNRQVSQLLEHEGYEQAMNIAVSAYDLARKCLKEDDPAFIVSLSNLARLYQTMGDYEQAEPLLRQELEIRRIKLGEAHPDVADSLNNLAMLYYAMGAYKHAEHLFQQSLSVRRTTLGEGHPGVAQSLNNLAALYQAMGEYEQAELFLQQALMITQTSWGEAHPSVAICLSNLATLYMSKGKYGEAESLLQQALEIRSLVPQVIYPDFVVNLNNLAMLYYETGKYGQAEPLLRQALEITRTTLGENHPDFATSLNDLAVLYFETGNYQQAEPLLQQALGIRRIVLGEIHPLIASNLDNLALLHKAMGDYGQAESLYRRALEMRNMLLGEGHPEVAQNLNNLAALYREMGNYQQAEALYEQALTIWRTALGEKHPDFAGSLSNLAALYQDMGDYKQAKALYEQVVEITRTALGEDHPDVANCLHNLATLYFNIADYGQAKALYEQVVEITRTALGEDHPDVATSLSSLATLYQAMGNYQQAGPLYRRALEIRRKVLGEKHPFFARSLQNLATLYFEIGDYRQAGSLSQQVLEIRRTALGEKHPDFAASLNDLAALYRVMRDYEQAEPLLRQALEIRRTALGEAHPNVATCLNELATLYLAMEDYEQAEPPLRQALEIRRTALGEAHPDVASSLINLAMLQLDIGNYEQAEPLLRQALEIRRTALGEAHPDVATCLNELAAVCVVTANAKEAFTLMEQAAIIDDQMIRQVFSIGSESQRMAYLTSLQWHFDIFLSLVFQHLMHSSAAVQVALDLVLRRKAIGIEALTTQRDVLRSGRYPALEPNLRDLIILRTQIAKKTLVGPGPEGPQVYQQLLKEWNVQREQLEAELAHQIPEMNLAEKLQITDRVSIAKALPTEGVLVEFVHFYVCNFQAVHARGEPNWKPAHYLAFILPAEEPDNVQMIDLGEADVIDRMIVAFRESVTNDTERHTGRHLEPVLNISHQVPNINDETALRTVVFDPLMVALEDHTRLFLAPDGDLTRLPFEILPMNDGSRLIDKFHIGYLGAGRDVLRFGTASSIRSSDPLVVADPAFDLSGSDLPTQVQALESQWKSSRDLDIGALYFGRLPGTRAEGERIAKMLDVQPLIEDDAVEQRLKMCSSPYILHIATHGFFLANQQHDPNTSQLGLGTISGIASDRMSWISTLENPLLRSGLALAGANTWNRGGTPPPEAEDGLLTAEDVSGLDLLDTELVVLSACETGLGEVRVGEGVFGLRRAFVIAGARTLVMSLWKVPDRQTQELMEDFYRRIFSGQSRADALREAQLAIKAKYPQPYYWGAFICQGDPGPLLQISELTAK